jgi:DNA-binding transcriptional MocR family regulator
MPKGFFMSNHIFGYLLSPVEFSVYAYLCRCRSSKSGTCFPSFNKIAGACNISKRSVSNALNRLEELQLISRENQFRERRQTSNLYTLLEVNPLPAPGANDACSPAQPVLSPGEPVALEINQPNEIKDTHQEGHSVNEICGRAGIEYLPDADMRETLRILQKHYWRPDAGSAH